MDKINYVVLFHDETDTGDYLVWEFQTPGKFVQDYGGVRTKSGRDRRGIEYLQYTGEYNQPATKEALEGILENATDKTIFYLRTKGIDGKFKPESKEVSRTEFVKTVASIARADH
jgi:hypothetical protein